jgi:hypothetical protein
MLKILSASILLLGASSIAAANQKEAANQVSAQPKLKVCVIEGIPDSSQYQIKKHIKAAKGTYGSVVEVYPRFVERAHQVGGNVVINYHASQRFGFWPWRFVRPVVWGTAVKWNTPVDCKKIGGVEL